jgi:hypothetical protein
MTNMSTERNFTEGYFRNCLIKSARDAKSVEFKQDKEEPVYRSLLLLYQ